MIEVKNKTRHPVQVMVRATRQNHAFHTTVIPGIGKGKNVRRWPEELITEQIRRLEKEGLLALKETND
jgi:hypothetical protein